MDQNHTSQLLFIHPQNPSKSFYYDISNSKEIPILLITQAIEKEKQCYFVFTDVFGRKLPENATEDHFNVLQPFYIKKMVPKLVNLHMILPITGKNMILKIDPERTLVVVKKFMEEKAQIPFEQQIYFINEKKLFDDLKLVDQYVVEEDVEVKFELKPNFMVKCSDGKLFEVYLEMKETGNELVRTIRRKKKELLGIGFSVICNDENEPLNVDKTLEQNSLKSGDVLYVKQNIEVSISGMSLQESFAPSMKILDMKKYFMSQKDELFGEDFDLEYKKTILEEDRPLSGLKSFKTELQIRPKSGFLLVQFVSIIDKYSPSLVVFDKNETLSDLIKETFKRHYREDLCVFYHKDKKISHEQVLKDLCPSGKDTIELTYKISWDRIYSGFQIYLVTITGKKISVFGNPWDTIERLKTQIYDRISLPPDEQKIIFAGRQVEDNKTLSDYNIQKDSVLHLVLRTTGGVGGGTDFLDITQSHKAKCFDWAEKAPEWRMAKRGLCLEGKCYNRSCQAFGRLVIINKGMGTYDVVADIDKNKCPICEKLVSVEKCAFNNCRYGYVGIKLEEDEMTVKKVITQEEIEVGDFYQVLDPEIVGKVSWKTLKIMTKNVDDKTAKKGVICGICREEVSVNGKILEVCKHVFHDTCLENIKGVVSGCAYCHF